MVYLPKVENHKYKENNVVKFEEAVDVYKDAFKLARGFMAAVYMDVPPSFRTGDFDQTKVIGGQVFLTQDLCIKLDEKYACFCIGFYVDCLWSEKKSSFEPNIAGVYFAPLNCGLDFLTPLSDDIGRFQEFSNSFFGKGYSNPFTALTEELLAAIDFKKLGKRLCALAVEEDERLRKCVS